MVDAELWKTVAVAAETVLMDTQSDLKRVPATGIQLRKAGVQFDAVRVDGDEGRDLADRLARMTGGAPGPVVEEATGNRRYLPTTPDRFVHTLLLRTALHPQE